MTAALTDIFQLEQALEVSEKDVKDASSGVLKDLKRFQSDKEDDLRKYMVSHACPSLDILLIADRSILLNVTSNGPSAVWVLGKRRSKRS